ncbi:hypothetical protein THAOC_13830 [Thalassiosira oceanica]|uniref:Uncharacterized protein n=1 Tax=Thalassiosira oceanica TaxID=159749 RepID=K0SK34_THAOC|nr:hypothetical protein THAOC_13830 [Thalassiosira oceanica]|eukprot:EJK65319.1 hypothetical protein THAOC_13830 [Thalassiosira oceanica]
MHATNAQQEQEQQQHIRPITQQEVPRLRGWFLKEKQKKKGPGGVRSTNRSLKTLRIQSPSAAQHRVWFSTLTRCLRHAKNDGAPDQQELGGPHHMKPNLPYFDEQGVQEKRRNSLKNAVEATHATPKDQLSFLREITGNSLKHEENSLNAKKSLFAGPAFRTTVEQESDVEITKTGDFHEKTAAHCTYDHAVQYAAANDSSKDKTDKNPRGDQPFGMATFQQLSFEDTNPVEKEVVRSSSYRFHFGLSNKQECADKDYLLENWDPEDCNMKPPSREKPEDFVAGVHEVLSSHLSIAYLRMIRPRERSPVPVGYEYGVTSRLDDFECNFIEMLTDMR